MSARSVPAWRDGGFYCTDCGALFADPGEGRITCKRCGASGLRGFEKVPVRVGCPEADCDFVGWDDGGVNDDLGRHARRDHAQPREG